MRTALLAALLGLVASACAEPLTEIVVVADTDLAVPAELDVLRVTVTDTEGVEQQAQADLAAGAPRPVTLGLVSRDGHGTLEIVVTGERGGIEILRRTARVSFARSRTLALRMDLWRRCAGQLCGAERTCGDDGCRSVDVEDAELIDWSGEPPPARDAAIALDAGLDAGPPPIDAGRVMDAAAPIDARAAADAGPQRDAYVAPVDSFVPECLTGEDCEDGWTCTADTCEGGRCVRVARDDACDDGLACTSDRCDTIAGCVYDARDAACDDGVTCTADVCDRLIGCRSEPVHATCSGGSYCDATAGCTVAPTFDAIYTTIIQARCGPCHITSASRGGGLDLATAALAHDSLVGVTATCGGGVNTIVVPGDSGRSLLWRKVAGVDLCGSRMPRGMALPLDDAQIAQIAHWIEAGALE